MKFYLGILVIFCIYFNGALGMAFPFGLDDYSYLYGYEITPEKEIDFEDNIPGSEELITDVNPNNFVRVNDYDYDNDLTFFGYETSGDGQEQNTDSNSSEEETTTSEYTPGTIDFTTKSPLNYQSNLLKDIFHSPSADSHLTGLYSDLMTQFAITYLDSRDDIKMLERDSDNIRKEIQDIDINMFNYEVYDGNQHKRITEALSNMMSTENKIREKILKMQSMEQKRNFHLLLNSLLKEIYGESKTDLVK